MRLFTVDSKLYKAMVTLWDAVKLNFMWILFSLPIITIGASTTAAFSVTLKMIENNEGHVVRQFIQAFKENWKQGIPMGLIVLVVAYCAYLNFEIFNQLPDGSVLLLISGVLIIFFGLLHITYAFPLSARYKNSLRETFSNSKEIAIKFFFRTVLLWILIALLIVVFILNYTLMLIGLLVGPVSIFLVVSSFAVRFFRQIEKDSLSY